jgi:hypothetical protein
MDGCVIAIIKLLSRDVAELIGTKEANSRFRNRFEVSISRRIFQEEFLRNKTHGLKSPVLVPH